MKEQSGNVYENKGALWKKSDEAGMLLIAKEILLRSGNVVEKNRG
jgi:hypothetical protein